MIHYPSRIGKLTFASTLIGGLIILAGGDAVRLPFVTSARAQTAAETPSATPGDANVPAAQTAPVSSATTPTAADQRSAEKMVHGDAQGRHLAPHDTFYILSYVAVKTGTGVEGFDPGQEVHLVEVHQPSHTLVVTDGHAQVEVPPSKLTNDMDIAATARLKDQANQAKITAYTQAEQEAYNKFEREAADATAKDLEQHKEQQQKVQAEERAAEQAPVAQTAPNQNTPLGGNGYYGYGGYGYGSPYGYFTGAAVTTGVNTPATQPPAPAPATSAGGKVASPGGRAGGRAK